MTTYRVDDKEGRTIYEVASERLVGVMDSPRLAAMAVHGMNANAAQVLARIARAHSGRQSKGDVYCIACGGLWPCLTHRLAMGTEITACTEHLCEQHDCLCNLDAGHTGSHQCQDCAAEAYRTALLADERTPPS